MFKTIVVCFLIFMCNLAFAGKNTLYVEAGHSYHLNTSDERVVLTNMTSVGVRHLFDNGFFVQVRINDWSGGDHSGTWVGPGFGYRFDKNKTGWFF